MYLDLAQLVWSKITFCELQVALPGEFPKIPNYRLDVKTLKAL